MGNLKLKLFNFNKKLTIEQSDVSAIVEAHSRAVDDMSELELYGSLNAKLAPFKFYENVKSFVEELYGQLQKDELLYELKDIYKKMERSNHGNLYQQPLHILLDVINTPDKDTRMDKILNELSIYDWVPEVKALMWRLSSTPQDKQKYGESGGRGEPVYSLAFTTNEGYMCLIKNKWFHLTDSKIFIDQLENHISNDLELKKMRLLETAVEEANIDGKRINFRLDENLTLGLSMNSPGKIYLNEDEANAGTTLESLFQSPVVPFMSRNYYPVIAETAQNLRKFVELDVTQKVTNLLNPTLECYVFNYKNNVYLYRHDKFGSTLTKYESALGLVNELKKELGFDLTYFYKDKISKNLKNLKTLEDNEKVIKGKIDKIEEALEVLEATDDEYRGMEILTRAENKLLAKKHKLLEGLKKTRMLKNYILSRP